MQMYLFKDCRLQTNGRKWVHIYSPSNMFSENVKILKESFKGTDFKEGQDLVLSFIKKGFFLNITDPDKIRDVRDREINKYCDNVIRRCYIINFLLEL